MEVLYKLSASVPVRLDEYNKALEAFRKKDSPVLNMDEMKTNVETLGWLGTELAAAKQELFVSAGGDTGFQLEVREILLEYF